jgi:osmotically inducible protein OsmC
MINMVRTAHAIWKGSLKEGAGTISTQSGGLKDTAYSFNTRFGDGVGVNPEELIASAHAACFSMALGGQLGERGITPESIDTTAAVTMENLSLTKSVLTTTVKAPGADKTKVEEAAAAAKAGCPISKVLNLEITLDLTVEV